MAGFAPRSVAAGQEFREVVSSSHPLRLGCGFCTALLLLRLPFGALLGSGSAAWRTLLFRGLIKGSRSSVGCVCVCACVRACMCVCVCGCGCAVCFPALRSPRAQLVRSLKPSGDPPRPRLNKAVACGHFQTGTILWVQTGKINLHPKQQRKPGKRQLCPCSCVQEGWG